MSARQLPWPPLGPTPLQVAWATQLEIYAVVREHLSERERESFWSMCCTRLSYETSRDLDWLVWEKEQRS